MRAWFLAIALVLASALPGLAAQALIVQSTRDAIYSEAARGFRSAFLGSSRTVVLSDYSEVDLVRLVKEERPLVLVAVGESALAASRKVRDTEVVAVLAPSLGRRKQPANVSGIDIVPAPEQFLRLFRSLGTRRIGVIYDPDKMGHYVGQTLRQAREQGLVVIPHEMTSPAGMQAALARLQGVDALWMLPDSTVLSALNLEAVLVFSMANRIPVVSYLRQHLSSGAAVSLDLDPFDLGRQAAELSLAGARNGGRIRGPVAYPRKAVLHTNEIILRKLGLPTPSP